MELTIYNVYVPMESQEQCDRMKQICIDNGFPYPNWDCAFDFEIGSVFGYDNFGSFFILLDNEDTQHTEVTEQGFIKLI